MGYSVNTTYVNHEDARAVADELVSLCLAEGMEQIPPPSQRQRLLVEPMQYEGALQNDLWGVAVFPGARSWTVVQTAPLELLSERAAGSARMRLADLCMRLSTSAFQLNVYDGTAAILVEAAKGGEVFISGFSAMNEADPLRWHGEQLREDLLEAQFQLHPFQDSIADAALGEDKAKMLAERFGGQSASFCDNRVSVDTLISHKPFTAPGGIGLYFRWSGQSRQRSTACATWEEYRRSLDRR